MEENIFYNEANDEEEEVSQDKNENCTESEEECSIFDDNDKDDEFYYDISHEDSENNENEVEFQELEDKVMLKCCKTISIFNYVVLSFILFFINNVYQFILPEKRLTPKTRFWSILWPLNQIVCQTMLYDRTLISEKFKVEHKDDFDIRGVKLIKFPM